ncbi:hypothetical protein BGZ98_000286 [Dissophora globulifera]|nr:hypothetical protein BGZ98_000286 [Dissophora globulifera]
MTLQEHKIVLTLKFDSPQYIIAQRQDGPPAIGETMSTLRRLVFGEDMQTRFPFQMGHAMLEKQHRTLAGWTRNQSRVHLQTAEEIITLSPRISSKRHSKHNRHENLPDEVRDIQALGWTGGYDVHHEFQRLKFDPSLWSVTHINADFELSPTYPEQFIMPNSFLDPDETTKFSDHTNKTLSTPRYSADNLGPPKHSSFENPNTI